MVDFNQFYQPGSNQLILYNYVILNPLKAKEIDVLSIFLQHNPQITKLSLCISTAFVGGTEAAAAFARLIQKTNLRELSISNHIYLDSAKIIEAAIEKNSTLVNIRITIVGSPIRSYTRSYIEESITINTKFASCVIRNKRAQIYREHQANRNRQLLVAAILGQGKRQSDNIFFKIPPEILLYIFYFVIGSDCISNNPKDSLYLPLAMKKSEQVFNSIVNYKYKVSFFSLSGISKYLSNLWEHNQFSDIKNQQLSKR